MKPSPDRSTSVTSTSSEERQRQLERLLRHRKRRRSAESIPRRPRPPGALFPLTFAQEALWFVDQLEPEEARHNVPCAIRLDGPLDVEALRRSLETLVERHEALRTTFHLEDGKPRQRIHSPTALELEPIDLLDRAGGEREAEALRRATAEAHRPFDLARGPLFRCALLRLSPERHVLLLNFHHLITDGWSMGVFTDELRRLYRGFLDGAPIELPDVGVQMVDLALWQRRTYTEEALERQLDYWRNHLRRLPVFELPADRPRPATPSFRGDHRGIRLGPDLSNALRGLARRENVTLFILLTALFEILLCHATGRTDVVIGSAIAHRNRVELEGVIGFLVNMLVLRTDLAEDRQLGEILSGVRETVLGALSHQEVPLNRIIHQVQPRRDPGRTPLFQIEFSLLTPDRNPAVYGYGLGSGIAETLELPDLVVSSFPVDYDNARYDLAVFLWDLPDGISGTFEYRSDLFEPSTIARLVERYESLLRHAVENPGATLSALLGHLERMSADQRRAAEVRYEERLTSGLRELMRDANEDSEEGR